MKKTTTLILLFSIILTGCNKPNTSEFSESSPDSINGQDSSSSQIVSTSEEDSLNSAPVSEIQSTSELASEVASEENTQASSEHNDELPLDVKAYYQGVDLNLNGDQLKSELYNKIKAHTTFGYSGLNNIMKTTDRDWNLSPDPSDTNPYMHLIYGTYNFSTATAKRHSTQNSIWDKEHIWAKSHGDFGTSNGAGSDLHHLRASDKYNNNGRSSLDFGRVDSLKKWVNDTNGTGKPSGRIGSQNNYPGVDVYEPMDIYKGDVARAVFYMATRYSVGSPTLFMSNEPTQRTSSPGHLGILSTLLEWNELDPVDEFEFNRNGLVQEYQKNRNPFIDYPWLAPQIWA